jgi:phosphatidylglycerol lysyltransferase
VVLGYFLLPKGGFVSSSLMQLLFAGCSAGVGAYFGACLFFKGKTFNVLSLTFRVPSLGTGLAQGALGVSDSILAGLVLYFLTMHATDISVVEFVCIFVIAQAAGVFSQVPGGIGVFESVFMVAMPDSADKAVLFGSLLAFRIIYYLIPLTGVGGMFFIYEHYLRQKMKRWLIFSLPKLKHRGKS